MAEISFHTHIYTKVSHEDYLQVEMWLPGREESGIDPSAVVFSSCSPFQRTRDLHSTPTKKEKFEIHLMQTDFVLYTEIYTDSDTFTLSSVTWWT